MVGARNRWTSTLLRGVSRVAVVVLHAYAIRRDVPFGHSGVIRVWRVAVDRWVRERSRIDAYVRVSVERGIRVLRMAISVWVGLGLRGRMVRCDVIFAKIGADGSSWLR